MSKFKKGQKVRCIHIDCDEGLYINPGEIVTIDEDGSRIPYALTADGRRFVADQHHYEALPTPATDKALEWLKDAALNWNQDPPETSHDEGCQATILTILRDVYGLELRTATEFVPSSH